MNLISHIVAPLNTYFELTVSEPCKAITRVTRERGVFLRAQQRFSLLGLLRKHRQESVPTEDERQPLVRVASVKDRYYRDWD